MATAKRLRPDSPTDPELGIRTIQPSSISKKKEFLLSTDDSKQLKVEPHGQDILFKHIFRPSPVLGFGRRRKTSKKGRKSRKTRKH